MPGARGTPAIATDPANNETLLFGGENGASACLNDTWTLVKGTWSNLTLSNAPPVDCAGSMVWDARDGYFLLFGGDPGLGNAAYNETWAFVNGSWKNLTSAIAPPAGFAVGLVYDARDQYVLEYGGIHGGIGSFNYTWTYQAGNWTNITATAGSSPSQRGFVGITYDVLRKTVYLFGGRDYPYGLDLGDTWSFAGGKWTELSNGSISSPDARRGVGFAYDPRYGYDVLFGGESTIYEELNDTWIFNGIKWQNISTLASAPAPTGGFGFGFLFVSNGTGDLVFGGCTGYGCGTVGGGEWTYNWNLTASLSANPVGLVNGSTLVLTGNATGGTFDYGFNYSRLPPGCTSVNRSTLTCQPDRLGNYTPELTAQDFGYLPTNITVAGPTIYVVVPLTNEPNVAAPAIDYSQTEWINSTTSGGAPGYTYNYSSLPKGCTSANVPDLACSPTATGRFTVTVTVSDVAKDTNTTYATFNVNSAISVAVAPSAAVVDVGIPVTFNATPHGGDGSYRFDWLGTPPGCQNSTGPSLTCIPSTPGYLNITVAVDDTLNGTAGLAQASVSVPSRPTAAIQVAPTNGTAPFTVTFAAEYSGGVGPFSENWVFGDGVSQGFSDVSHTYYAGGVYTATLWFNDSDGVGGHSSVVINVAGRGAVSLTSSAWSAEVGQTVTLNATVTGGQVPYSYAWQGLPTGCASADVGLLTCAPSAAAVTAVTVTVTDADRATFSSSHSLAVTSHLAGSGSASVESACGYPQNVSYVASATFGLPPYRFAWQFPDGAMASTATASRIYVAAPSAPAILTVTDSLGVAVTQNVSVTPAVACATVAPTGSTGGVPAWEWAAFGLGVAAVAATVGVFAGRRRTPPMPLEDAGSGSGATDEGDAESPL